ncbi:MAG: SHOCT domain-containing protein [Firmicutes bacterium]|nr:SHOCT domain-containing protein [Bacillota bacterium]
MRRKVTVRPSRASALMGAVVGGIFCLIGFVVVIPNAGAFGILWTAIAVFITGSNLYNALSDKGISSHTIEVEEEEDGDGVRLAEVDGALNDDDAGRGSTVDRGSEVERRLERLNDLYDKRLVTQREYEEKRKEILKDL